MYILHLPVARKNSLLHLKVESSAVRSPRLGRWFPLLTLVWSVWLFVTPLYNPRSFPHWLWPTLGSYVVFLGLFYVGYYRDRRHMPMVAAGMAVLGFALTPFNPGAQTYIIYACAFLAFIRSHRWAVIGMVLLQLAFLLEWKSMGWPLIYWGSTAMMGLAVGAMNISIDRKAQADAALRLSHDEVRRLAVMAERERIGRDLHDLLGHTLSLVALKSDLAGKLLARDINAARREMDEVSQVARDALAQVRHAVTGIRATGLAAELVSARLLLESSGIALDGPTALPPVSPHQETVLSLTLREAVTNLQRHARASHAQVDLYADTGYLRLRVQDNGRGGGIVPGNGLRGMRERLESLGGSLHIDAQPGRGTVLEASVPV